MSDQQNSNEVCRSWELPNGRAQYRLERTGSRTKMKFSSPNFGEGTSWERCSVQGCFGEAVIQTVCFTHAKKIDQENYLRSPNPNIFLSFRGNNMDQQAVSSLGDWIYSEIKIKAPISFAGAEIDYPIRLSGIEFQRDVDFVGATFFHPFEVHNCIFNRPITGRFSFFNSGPPSFDKCIFNEAVDLSYAQALNVSIGFADCKFARSIYANGLSADFIIERSDLGASISIQNANTNMIVMRNCKIEGEIELSGTECKGFHATNMRAASANKFGPLRVEQGLFMSNVTFDARILIDVNAAELDLSGARFSQGGNIQVDRALVDLRQLTTGGPLRISGLSSSRSVPKVGSLRDADVGSMTFAHVDMSETKFYGSHNLSGVVLERTVQFHAKTPKCYTDRRCIADEIEWRRTIGGISGLGWKRSGHEERLDEGKASMGDFASPALSASQIAAVYRDLRRSFETAANQPGAADFYYGEMEMRRLDSEARPVERLIIWLYWILSGYGLRASRSFLALGMLLLIGARLSSHSGFKSGPVTFSEGMNFAAHAALPGLHKVGELTVVGDWTEMTLSLLAPFLFALGVLALRGRVKR